MELIAEQRSLRQPGRSLCQRLRRDGRPLHLGEQLRKLRAKAPLPHRPGKNPQRVHIPFGHTTGGHGQALLGEIGENAAAVLQDTLGQPFHGKHLHADEALSAGGKPALRGKGGLLRHDEHRALAPGHVGKHRLIQRVRPTGVRPAEEKAQPAQGSILCRWTGV